MPTITDLVTDLPKTYGEMTYLKKKNIDEAIRQKLRKKDVYESFIHNIYNLIVGQTNEQLQEKAGIGRHFPGGQNWPRTNRLPDDPEEDLLLKPIQTTPNPLIFPFYEAPV